MNGISLYPWIEFQIGIPIVKRLLLMLDEDDDDDII